MKKIIIISISMVSYFISASFTVKEETYTLVVETSDLRNNIGVVQFALYNKNGSVPDEKYKKYYKMKVGEIKKNTSSIAFKNLPKGKYAVNILHDENKDGKIEKGWVLPIEGVGFSNINKIGIGNKPNFSKASFQLNSNKTIRVKIIYM